MKTETKEQTGAMNIGNGRYNRALSGMPWSGFQVVDMRAKTTVTAKNKNIGSTSAKRLVTSIDSTLELPVKKFREMGRKLSHINAGTYS